jgi:hypothetical protein
MMMGQNGLIFVEWPQVVRTRAGTVFFGDNAMVLTVTDSGFGRIAGWPRGPGMLAGMIQRANGQFEPVSLPYSMRSFVAVRAIGDGSGKAHVFWGDSRDTTSNQSDHLLGLKYAAFDGSAWSEPAFVLRDTAMTWYPVYSSIASRGGDLHLVMPGYSHKPDLIHLLRKASGEVIARRYAVAARYTSLATASDGALVLGYVHDGDRTNRSAISVMRSLDGGTTWSEPVGIHRSGYGAAYAIRLVETSTGLYAIWEASPPVTPLPDRVTGLDWDLHDSVQAAVSRDHGRTWTRLPGLPTPNGAAGLVAVRGPDDAVHIAYQAGPRDTAVIATASLRNDEWTTPESRGRGPFWPTLSPIGDSLLLTWEDWQFAGPERAPMTRWAMYHCSHRL